MSSVFRGTEGGGFSKADRFGRPPKNHQTPGPNYDVGTWLNDKIRGPVYVRVEREKKSVVEQGKEMPHPSKDRTAWMIGTCRNDMAYMAAISEKNGPAQYAPDHNRVKHTYPRNKFGQDKRFQSLTKQYLNKELNTINYCTAGPGPKYFPPTSNTDLETSKGPEYSFRSKGDLVSDRGSFLNATIKGGYLYQSKPATNGDGKKGGMNVGPANYTPDMNVICATAPRPKWGVADRFKVGNKIFISKKHSKGMTGDHSPGPKYNALNGTLTNELTAKPTGVAVAGKWTPF